jgi:hypothetical protein
MEHTDLPFGRSPFVRPVIVKAGSFVKGKLAPYPALKVSFSKSVLTKRKMNNMYKV